MTDTSYGIVKQMLTLTWGHYSTSFVKIRPLTIPYKIFTILMCHLFSIFIPYIKNFKILYLIIHDKMPSMMNWQTDEWPKSNMPSNFLILFVEVLWPSQPNGVISSTVSLPDHSFTGQV